MGVGAFINPPSVVVSPILRLVGGLTRELSTFCFLFFGDGCLELGGGEADLCGGTGRFNLTRLGDFIARFGLKSSSESEEREEYSPMCWVIVS